MMTSTPIATASSAVLLAGLLMAACGSVPAGRVAPPDAMTMLERACLSAPLNAAHWARLASALEADGQRERATRFYRQAAMLAAHDARRDYALLAGTAAAAAAAPAPAAADPYAGMPRTQVQQIGAALWQVVRVAPPPMMRPSAAPAAPATMATMATMATTASGPLRLEISNGNGVPGAAASLARVARTLELNRALTVRLTNARPFNVRQTWIEYPQAQREMAEVLAHRLDIPLQVRRDSASRELRIVLGHDSGRPK